MGPCRMAWPQDAKRGVFRSVVGAAGVSRERDLIQTRAESLGVYDRIRFTAVLLLGTQSIVKSTKSIN